MSDYFYITEQRLVQLGKQNNIFSGTFSENDFSLLSMWSNQSTTKWLQMRATLNWLTLFLIFQCKYWKCNKTSDEGAEGDGCLRNIINFFLALMPYVMNLLNAEFLHKNLICKFFWVYTCIHNLCSEYQDYHNTLVNNWNLIFTFFLYNKVGTAFPDSVIVFYTNSEPSPIPSLALSITRAQHWDPDSNLNIQVSNTGSLFHNQITEGAGIPDISTSNQTALSSVNK